MRGRLEHRGSTPDFHVGTAPGCIDMRTFVRVNYGMSEELFKQGIPSALPPEETIGPEIQPASKVAGGIPAIIQTLKATTTEMGLMRGVRTLLQINQQSGIDC